MNIKQIEVCKPYTKNGLLRGYVGEGNGTPLQYSCLENPMDGGRYVTYIPKLPFTDTCNSKARDIVSTSKLNRRRQWHPTPVLLPGKSHGRRSLEGCSPWGR